MTSRVLTSSDRCDRREFLERSWERNSLHPSQILRRAIAEGLQSDSDDPGQSAGDHAMSICVSRPIETDSADLIGIAEHIAALADLITWTVRGDSGPWEHPEDVAIGGHLWESSAFLSANGTRLRRLLTVDRWPEGGDPAILNSWAVAGECAAYGLEMDLLLAVVGQRRDERWISPWTRGVEHPVSRTLRFQKRDGEAFGPTWERVFREHFRGERQDWLDALTEDGVLTEILLVHQVPVPAHAAEIRALAEKKLQRLALTVELPDPQLSNCFNPVSPCQFRSACPYWRLPSAANGFISPL